MTRFYTALAVLALTGTAAMGFSISDESTGDASAFTSNQDAQSTPENERSSFPTRWRGPYPPTPPYGYFWRWVGTDCWGYDLWVLRCY